ncbi:MAG: DUF433 domain-containing protein [Deltaproteobacteria bacterium]|nr:DUF433 domain-containing protein [Deltaproteobacteria bacterium]
MTVDQILDDYADLEREDIQAVLAYRRSGCDRGGTEVAKALTRPADRGGADREDAAAGAHVGRAGPGQLED